MRYLLITIFLLLLFFPSSSSLDCITITKHNFDTCYSRAVNSALPNWWRLRYRKKLESQRSLCWQMANIQYDRCVATLWRTSTSQSIHMIIVLCIFQSKSRVSIFPNEHIVLLLYISSGVKKFIVIIFRIIILNILYLIRILIIILRK